MTAPAATSAVPPQPLAIVIPTWRAQYLDAALASLAAQTDRRFTVYVGDDASPDDIAALCARHAAALDLRHHRFAQNLGGQDLIAQWTRCVQLSTEPWVWMIGDDDLLEPGCVAAFHAARVAHPQAPLFHFAVRRIDAQGRTLALEPEFPAVLSARAFLAGRLRFELASFAPDYVFARQAFDAAGGFQRFPLAWCSDDATWARLAAHGGICSVGGPRVCWRLSGSNISSRDARSADVKTEAHLQFIEWLRRALPGMPRQPGDMDDAALLRWSAWWFFEQCWRVGARLGPMQAWRAGRRLARSGACSLPEALLRAARARWQPPRAARALQ